MAAIHRDRDGCVESDGAYTPPDLDCLICSEPADCFWSGGQTVGFCRDCAVEKLPKLIADAVATRRRHSFQMIMVFRGVEEQIRRAFWEGAAITENRNATKLHNEKVFANFPRDFDFNSGD